MKEYPSIPSSRQNLTVYVFKKLDGSNIRAEWDKKKGFWKFGSRRHLIDETDLQLGDAVRCLKTNGTLEQMDEVFRKNGYRKAMVFAEYWGDSSSHGYHKPDEPHRTTVIDVSVENRGLLLPKDFLKFVPQDSELGLFLGHEKWNDPKTRAVYDGVYPGQTYEGVVCKANTYVTPGIPLMFKCKSSGWLKKLKELGRSEDDS